MELERNYDCAWCQDIMLFVSEIATTSVVRSSDHYYDSCLDVTERILNKITVIVNSGADWRLEYGARWWSCTQSKRLYKAPTDCFVLKNNSDCSDGRTSIEMAWQLLWWKRRDGRDTERETKIKGVKEREKSKKGNWEMGIAWLLRGMISPLPGSDWRRMAFWFFPPNCFCCCFFSICHVCLTPFEIRHCSSSSSSD